VLIVATVFSASVFCDFSGYTDIARGGASHGFELMINFDRPYAEHRCPISGEGGILAFDMARDYIFEPVALDFGSVA